LKTDFGGLPIAFHLTGGEASDSRNFETLLDLGPDTNPRAALADKGYDSKSNREAARQRRICPAIPYRSNTKVVPAFFPKALYKARARIEQAVGKLKRFKRIALRCEKTARNYGSFVALALGFILIKSVHTARTRLNCREIGMYYAPYGSLAKLNAALCAASCVVFAITIFTSNNLINEYRLLLVCGGATIVFYYMYKLIMDTFRVA
jgi:transposase